MKPNPALQLRCVIYIRVSSRMQLDGHSLDAQRDLCLKFAESRGWTVVKIFEGEGESAKNDKRKAFQEMIAYVRTGGADIVLTHKIDRFARNVVDALSYLHEFNKIGVSYASATEQFDFTTPWGRMMLVMLAAFAELFLNNLSAETSKGKRKRAEKGFWNGDLPFGYRKASDGIHAELDPETAPGVKLAFAQYAEGHYSDLEIAKILNASGYRTKAKGKRISTLFSKDTVAALLQNPFYSGRVAYKGVLHPGQHTAVIDVELFEKCQTNRRKDRLNPRRPNASAVGVFPLSRLVYCSQCKRPLRGQNVKSSGLRYYRDPDHDYDGTCTNPSYLKADQIEAAVADILMAVRLPESWQEQITRQSVAADTKDQDRRRARAKAKMDRAKELYLEQLIDRKAYDLAQREAMAELDAIRPVVMPDIIRNARLLDDLPSLWEVATLEERKTLLQSMIERVFVRGTEVVAVQPTPEYAALLRIVYGGPDGFRTRDLGLDRAAC